MACAAAACAARLPLTAFEADFSANLAILPTFRNTAQTSCAADGDAGSNAFKTLASITRPFGNETSLWKMTSLSSLLKTGDSGKRKVETKPSNRNVLRCVNASFVFCFIDAFSTSFSFSASFSSSWFMVSSAANSFFKSNRSISSTSNNKYIASSIIILAASKGSFANRTLGSFSSSPDSSFSSSGPVGICNNCFGVRTFENGTLPNPSKPGTNVTSPLFSFTCEGNSLSSSGQNGSLKRPGLFFDKNA